MIWLDSWLTFAGKVRRSKSDYSYLTVRRWPRRAVEPWSRGAVEPSQTSMLTNSQSRGDLLVSSSEGSLALLRVIMYAFGRNSSFPESLLGHNVVR